MTFNHLIYTHVSCDHVSYQLINVKKAQCFNEYILREVFNGKYQLKAASIDVIKLFSNVDMTVDNQYVFMSIYVPHKCHVYANLNVFIVHKLSRFGKKTRTPNSRGIKTTSKQAD